MNPTPISYTEDDFNWPEFKKRVADEKEAIALLHVAIEDLIKSSNEVMEAFQQQDWPRLEYLIDRVADMSLCADMKNIESLTRQIYQLLKMKNLTHIEKQLTELNKVIAVAIQALKQEITNRD